MCQNAQKRCYISLIHITIHLGYYNVPMYPHPHPRTHPHTHMHPCQCMHDCTLILALMLMLTCMPLACTHLHKHAHALGIAPNSVPMLPVPSSQLPKSENSFEKRSRIWWGLKEINKIFKKSFSNRSQ